MKKIFIAGGAGYIGSACSDLARKELRWQPPFENAEAIIRSVWNRMQKYPNGYQDR